MKYRTLGKTNLTVSVIGIGTWQFGGEWGKTFTQDEVDRMLARGRDLGLNLIDTAECYGDHLSESLIGNAIKGERDKWILATKFGHKFHGPMSRTDERTAPQVRQQLEDSLRALETDYIDLYQFHSVADHEFNNEELRRALEEFVSSGKVRHIANSVRAKGDPMHQIERSPEVKVEAIQIVYNRLQREPERQALPACRRLNLGVLARVPLASGLLSGKYKPGQTSFAPGDHRAGQDKQDIDAKLREVERIAREEVPPGVNMAQWAIAWTLQHSAVTCTIPGCKSVEQVESNAKAAELPMVREDHPLAAGAPKTA
jgi:aryl-alcohol dehydrogenase-like predicted oxidoreductase